MKINENSDAAADCYRYVCRDERGEETERRIIGRVILVYNQ